MFADNPAYVEYERLLLLLHRLDSEGRGESDDAEAIRDRMDSLYWKLKPAEQARLGSLSAALHSLQGAESYEPLALGETQETLEEQSRRAWERQDMELLLVQLRKAPTFLTPEGVASLRSYAYQELGHLEAALLFKEQAARLNPSELSHRVGLMHLNYQLRYREAAAVVARQIIADPAAPPALVAAAGFILSQTASEQPEEQGENSFATARRQAQSQVESLLTAA